MKVAAIRAPGGLDKLVIEERAQPVAGPGELLVRVRASSLNFHDFAVVAGMIPSADGRIPMSDGAGEVVAVGEGVTGYAPGDRVLADRRSGPGAPAGRAWRPCRRLCGGVCRHAGPGLHANAGRLVLR